MRLEPVFLQRAEHRGDPAGWCPARASPSEQVLRLEPVRLRSAERRDGPAAWCQAPALPSGLALPSVLAESRKAV
ncbi:hypothetical protein G8O24_40485 [Bradyrhizobium sp. INPA01-394B]|nr:hypothetical protein [Bradyrhizobium campsiandrae]